MADNVPVTPGTGVSIASDDVSGVQFQKVKLDGGDDGVSLPIVATTTAPGANAAGLPTREVGQDIWSVGFGQTQTGIDSRFVELKKSTNVGASQASGNLAITLPVIAREEYLARSVASFSGSMYLRYKTSLVNRNANIEHMIMLADKLGDDVPYTNTTTTMTLTLPGHGFTAANVGQSVCIGAPSTLLILPGRYPIASVTDANNFVLTVSGFTAGSGTCHVFGHSFARVTYSGSTATTAFFDVADRGWSDAKVSMTINTTISPGHMGQVHLDGRSAYFSDSLVASSTTPTVATRASRVEMVPDKSVPLYLYIWSVVNAAGGSLPTWNVGFVSVETYANLPVYLAGMRWQGSASALPVSLVSPAILTVNNTTSSNIIGDVGITYRTTATGGALIAKVLSAATTNATSVKGSAGRVYGWQFTNSSTAFKYVKLFNLAVAPTVGTSVPVFTIGIPPSAERSLSLPGGIGFTTGISFSITNLAADNDTTVVAATDVHGAIFYA